VLGEEFLAGVYKKYAKDCYLYAFYFTKNKEQAQDLVSQAFLVLAESLDVIKEEQVKFFLLRVIKNRFIDWTRKQAVRQRWRFFSEGNSPARISHTTDTPLDEIILQESRRNLYQSIEKLPQDTREVILLYYFLDWTLLEIASYKDWSYTQTKNRIYRGRQLLKEDLTDE
jgi:RNA polymerase sigma-70 factor (ECF subfamily)